MFRVRQAMFSTADLEKMSISDLKVTGFHLGLKGVVKEVVSPTSARPSWKDWP